MGIFEYLGVLISVIMGLGITHLATGAAKLIQHRDSVRLYLPHALWTINVLLFILLIWWGMFWWSGHDSWYAYEYLFITLYAIVLFFLASILYPWEMREDFDVREYFLKNRQWFATSAPPAVGRRSGCIPHRRPEPRPIPRNGAKTSCRPGEPEPEHGCTHEGR